MKPLFPSALLRTQSDERLVGLVAAGHERAFETIVQRYKGPLERYCARALSRSEAEDAVQQVLMKAWASLSNGTEVRNLRPWLFRIAQTTVLEIVHKAGFDYEELARSLRAHEGPDSEFEKRALIRRTLVGLAALPVAQREALLRAAVDGESGAEIAKALGVSEGAVRQLLYRARVSLRSVATAITPLPLVVWVAKPAGVSGLAQVSAIVAGAGVVAAGPVAVHQLSRPDAAKAPAPIERSVPRRGPAKIEAGGRLPVTAPHIAKASTSVTRPGQSVERNGRERGSRKTRLGDTPSGGTARGDAPEQESPEASEAQGDSGVSETRARKEKRRERSRETSSRERRNGHEDDPKVPKPKPTTAKHAGGDLPRKPNPVGPAESGADGETTRKNHVKESSGDSGSDVGVSG